MDDDDVSSAGTQVCVAAGDTGGMVGLTGMDDSVFEGDETLSAGSGILHASAIITDDESPLDPIFEDGFEEP
jgi:hypothetical protein